MSVVLDQTTIAPPRAPSHHTSACSPVLLLAPPTIQPKKWRCMAIILLELVDPLGHAA